MPAKSGTERRNPNCAPDAVASVVAPPGVTVEMTTNKTSGRIVSTAANALHLTQGAVSQQVKRLEEALECSLFERDRRGLRLTLAGERLFGRAKRLLSLNDEIWAEMTTNAVEGRVRLGVPPDLVGTRLAPVLKRMRKLSHGWRCLCYAGRRRTWPGCWRRGTLSLPS